MLGNPQCGVLRCLPPPPPSSLKAPPASFPPPGLPRIWLLKRQVSRRRREWQRRKHISEQGRHRLGQECGYTSGLESNLPKGQHIRDPQAALLGRPLQTRVTTPSAPPEILCSKAGAQERLNRNAPLSPPRDAKTGGAGELTRSSYMHGRSYTPDSCELDSNNGINLSHLLLGLSGQFSLGPQDV